MPNMYFLKDMTRITGEGAKRSFLTIDGMICRLNENRESYTRQELISSLVSTLSGAGRDTLSDDINDDDDDDNCLDLDHGVTMYGGNYNTDTGDTPSSYSIDGVKSCVSQSLSCRLPPMVCDVLTPLILSYIGLSTAAGWDHDTRGMLDTMVTLMSGIDWSGKVYQLSS